MVVGSATHAYDQAGAVHTLLAPWAFQGDVLVSKRGDLAVAFRLHGVDYEGLDPDGRQRVAHRMETALRLLSEQWRVYSYLVKRLAPPLTATPVADQAVHAALQRRVAHWNRRVEAIYTIDLYLVLQYEGLPATLPRVRGVNWREPWRWAQAAAVTGELTRAWDDALAHVDQVARSVAIHLADTVKPALLSAADFFRFLCHLVNYDPIIAEASPLVGSIDRAMASSSIGCERTHLDIGAKTVQMLTMHDGPSATAAHLLEDLYALPGEFIATLEWRRLHAGLMRRRVKRQRTHYYNGRVSIVNFLSKSGREASTADLLVDTSKSAMVDTLGMALTETEVNGRFFGECSLTVALLGPDVRATSALVAEALKVMAAHDGRFHLETFHQLNAWRALVPGNQGVNVRRLALFETHAADLSFLFTLDQGSRTAPAFGGQDALFVFETPNRTPYFYNLHVGDVGHTLIVGNSGAGKSYGTGAIVLHAQKYHPRTVIFDVGHSYRGLAQYLGASYVTLGVKPPDFTINPFALEPTPEHLHFQHNFVQVLLAGADGYKVPDADQQELFAAIQHLPIQGARRRTLQTLAYTLPEHLSRRLAPWLAGGQFDGWFSHPVDTWEDYDCQVFDFSAMASLPVLFEPVLFYILHRTAAKLSEPGTADRFLLAVMDEAWALIEHPALRAYVEDALKTWRKRHAAIILATQAVEDFTKTALLRPVLDQCPTTLFLANPKLDRQAYAEWFRLSTAELAVITNLNQKRELALKRDGLMKTLILDLDPETHAVLSGGGNSNNTGPRLVERKVG